MAQRYRDGADGAGPVADGRIKQYGLLPFDCRSAKFVDDLQQLFQQVYALRHGACVAGYPLCRVVYCIRMAGHEPEAAY